MRALLVIGLFVGCAGAEAALAERQAILDAREAVMRYSTATPAAHALRGAWVAELAALRAHTEPGPIAQHVNDKLVPAIAAYASAIEALPTAPAFAAANRDFATAHRTLAAALGTFASGLERSNYRVRRAALALALLAFDKAQTAYVEAMKAHFASVGLVFTPHAV